VVDEVGVEGCPLDEMEGDLVVEGHQKEV